MAFLINIAVKSSVLEVPNGFNRLPSPVEETVETVKEVARCDCHRDSSRC